MTNSISLRSGLAGELDGLAYLRESLKLSARALFYRRQTRRWLSLLNSHPLFAQMLPSCPRLVNKIYRDYLSTNLAVDARLDALAAHYGFVIRTGLAPLVAQAAREPVELCRLAAKSDLGYRVVLRAGSVLVREGELILQLMHHDTLVFSVAFSFLRQQGGLTLGLGCLQGPSGSAGLDLVRNATRELHGLRPKNLLLRLVRQLGFDLGCRDLILVGNANRVVGKSSRKGRVHADYNALWEELHAVQRADGDYVLACEDLPALELESIASKKRSEARKRHEMQAVAIGAIRTHIQAARRAALALRLVYSAEAEAVPLAPRQLHLA